jgi:hypothetical protein
MSVPTYNRIIRKLIIGFGNLFDNITLVRYNTDNTESERVLVPIAYAPKERYVLRLEDDPNLDKKVQIALPRMSFEMISMDYDSSRKLNTNVKNFAQTNSVTLSQYNPVPYNFDFNLYLYTRNIEDSHQLIEHIIPFFTPDYTIKLNLIPEMGAIREVPIILNRANHEIFYEGPREDETRMIIWTLNFTVKGFIFGKQSSANLIRHTISSIYSLNTSEDVVSFVMSPVNGSGFYGKGNTVYQGYSYGTATATGIVKEWIPSLNILRVTDIKGNFNSTTPILSLQTNASYTYTSYSTTPNEYARIDVSVATIDSDRYTMDSTTITLDSSSNYYPSSIREKI